ncbi:DUF952 domain-containing protein [Pleurocapsa sp. CCALA 161]|nr:DUF952 domain-containing protein [Pleurocapsa sp. CCALA 161]
MFSPNTYHITSVTEWQEAKTTGEYKPKGFAQEQFIHLSYSHQLLTVANRFYAAQNGLVILVIDSSRIKDGLIEENLEGGIELYPHFYGVLPIDAVIDAIAFPCNADGSFDLPVELNI